MPAAGAYQLSMSSNYNFAARRRCGGWKGAGRCAPAEGKPLRPLLVDELLEEV